MKALVYLLVLLLAGCSDAAVETQVFTDASAGCNSLNAGLEAVRRGFTNEGTVYWTAYCFADEYRFSIDGKTKLPEGQWLAH